jgi:hypothetical protein
MRAVIRCGIIDQFIVDFFNRCQPGSAKTENIYSPEGFSC